MAVSSRFRNFVSVFYPESAPEDWYDIITSWHIPVFVSPLHCDDVNPDGEIKKPHYHIILMFEGKKSEEQVRAFFDQINCVGFEVVSSLRGYARYLCHLDNPEKAQYDSGSVLCFGGADYDHVIGLASDKYKAITEIIDYCKSNQIYSYADLLDYCSVHRYDWFKCLCDNGTFVVKEYLKSLRWSHVTGEDVSSEERDR